MSAKTLVAYFSASGVTRGKAAAAAAALGADLYEIAPVVRYSQADLDWHDSSSRSSVEMADSTCRPALAEPAPDLTAYDRILVGFPIWWGVAPRVVNTFIDNHDMAGKQLVIFATSGGSGLDYAVKDLQKTYPQLHIKAGKLLNGSVTEDIL